MNELLQEERSSVIELQEELDELRRERRRRERRNQ